MGTNKQVIFCGLMTKFRLSLKIVCRAQVEKLGAAFYVATAEMSEEPAREKSDEWGDLDSLGRSFP